ncbi:MAG: VCBS repeat-containing protein [Verrucomicrobiae bacterium]|nr:VCBS repeat-containing protein [Verrucomicrobiae bacterium]
MKFRRHLLLFLLVLSAAGQRAGALSFSINTITNVGPGPTYVAVADVNGDGKPDLICANYNGGAGNTLTVLTNNGSGVFGSNATYTVGSGVGVVVAADLNGDGKPDLVCNGNITIGSSTLSVLTVLTNDGTGLFVTNDVTLVTDSTAAGIVAADVNGDGRLDLISANLSANTLDIFTNSAIGLRPDIRLAAPGGPIWVVAADINGDGKIDLISANYNASAASSVTVWTNNGLGGFVVSATAAGGTNPRRVTVADLNGDGKPDLIVANYNTQLLTLLTNNGSGGFSLSATIIVGTGGAGDVVMADVTGDGRPDLISANSGANTLVVFTNDSSSLAFGYNTTLTLSVATCQPFCVTAADLNGDGKLDLVAANYNNSTLSVLLNTTVFPAPKLRLTQAGGKAVVSWPAWNGGFALQTNGNLAANAWNTYGGPLGYDGLKNNVTNTPVKNLFFRLVH